MEELKHECGVAMIRLLKSPSFYQEKYGTRHYGLNKLYLMMEKQHNRGQEGAGIACGRRAVAGAIDHILPNWKYTTIGNQSPNGLCGSAMLDFLAVGNQEGWLSSFGRLEKDELADRIRDIDGVTAAEIAVACNAEGRH